MSNSIYDKAIQNGCYLETTCVDCSNWDELMQGHTKANQKKAIKVALLAGVIDEYQYKMEMKNPHYNPYTHFKTKTHIIYVHSMIEHFIKVN